MALPLVVGDQVLGALDVQSTQEAAFAQEDIEVLQVLADQVAIAIENARLFANTQEALEATRRAYGDITRQAWEEMLRARPELGFRSDERGVTSAREIWRPEMERALNEGQTIQEEGNGSEAKLPLAIPIKVRGQVVGVLDTCKPEEANRWTAEEITTLEQITEQLGAALESARLYENVQRSAARERLTREITDQMRRATSVDGIVQTAVDSLFNVLGTSRAFARLEAAPPATDHEEDGQKQ
jgi:GAF domain-containing protein